jgi:hypothetical protein
MEELNVIAAIHVRLGQRCMRASHFKSAVSHFEVAKSALNGQLWSPERYEISLNIHNCLAEALYCTSDYDTMEVMLNDILSKAHCFPDKLHAYPTSVFANGARHLPLP